jgi:hypothetical protein
MKLRRRIASPRLRTTPTALMITAGICDRRNGVQRLVCTAAIPNRSCPLWVISGHEGASLRCPKADIDGPLRGAWEVPPAVEDSIGQQAGYAD